MADRPALSKAELEVARIVWRLSGATVRQVYEEMPESRDVEYKTVNIYSFSRSTWRRILLRLDQAITDARVNDYYEVVLEEMKMCEDAPEEVIFDRFDSVMYHDHALGRPILGYPETVRSFSQEQLFEHIDAHYTRDRIVLSVTGNVRHEVVVAIAEKVFAASRRGPVAWTRTPVNGYAPQQLVEARTIQQAHLIVGTRGIDVKHPKRSALTVLNTILGVGMSSRLNQNIREKYGYCYSVYSFVNMHSDTGDFGVYMGTDASRMARAQKLIFRELEKTADKPISTRALNQAKNQMKGSIMLGLESMSNRMMRIGQQELVFKRYFTLDEVLDEIDAVGVDDVQTTAQMLFQPKRFSSIVLLPQN
ncbi:MAG: insulinase family protein [Bacteroidetes bacterium]|nr:insulinase family protein [Bacteroidota bacterium]